MNEDEERRGRVEQLLGELQTGRRAEQQLAELIHTDYRRLLIAIGTDALDSRARAHQGPSDIFQDVWLSAKGDLWKFRGTSEAEFKSWLKQIYVHRLSKANADFERDAAARQETMPGSTVETPSEAVGHAEDDEARRLHLERILGGLSSQERVILVLREAFGFKYADIAYVLGDTEDGVRYTYNKAMLASRGG